MGRNKNKSTAQKAAEEAKRKAEAAAKRKAAEAEAAQKAAEKKAEEEAEKIAKANEAAAKAAAENKQIPPDESEKMSDGKIEQQRAEAETAAAKLKEQQKKEAVAKAAAEKKKAKAAAGDSLVIEPSDPYFAGIMRTVAKLKDGKVELDNKRIVIGHDDPDIMEIVEDYLKRSAGDPEHYEVMMAVRNKIQPKE
ncbi:MAG: hypothetical protein JXA04_01260 [Gammaproteobacteria bacterium]|nr:hypothetical protein [Gammaproteobacteria bacterium]